MEHFKITRATLLWINGVPLGMILCALFIQLVSAQPPQFVPWALVTACAALWGLFQLWIVPYFNSMVDMVSGTLRRDPWYLQRNLMTISGQRTPDQPALTNESLLYGALILEELGETLNAAAGVLFDQDPARENMAKDLATMSLDLIQISKDFRTKLEGFDLFLELPDEVAVELLDGVTDMVVVACGMCESMGLPGYSGYMEVYESNHSKVNPATGVIDKTADGKWIKGSGYFKPDLAQVLGKHKAWNRVFNQLHRAGGPR